MIRTKEALPQKGIPRRWKTGPEDGFSEKRSCERYPTSLQARLFFGDLIYSGMVTNLSKNGMFVSTQVRLPVNSRFMAVVKLKDKTVKFPVKVRRSVRHNSDFRTPNDRGIGVELLEIPQSYIEYIGARKSTLQTAY